MEFERASVAEVIFRGRFSSHFVAFVFNCSFILLALFLDGSKEFIFNIKLSPSSSKTHSSPQCFILLFSGRADGAWR